METNVGGVHTSNTLWEGWLGLQLPCKERLTSGAELLAPHHLVVVKVFMNQTLLIYYVCSCALLD